MATRPCATQTPRRTLRDYFSARAPHPHLRPPTHLAARVLAAFSAPAEGAARPERACARTLLSAEAAMRVLRLAPPPTRALIAYFLEFFTQLPLSPDKALGDVALLARGGAPVAPRVHSPRLGRAVRHQGRRGLPRIRRVCRSSGVLCLMGGVHLSSHTQQLV